MTLFTKDHEMFRREVRSFIEAHLTPYADEWESRQAFPTSVFRSFGREGLLGLTQPQDYGGRGLDFGYNLVLAEELPRSKMLGLTLSIVAQAIFFSPLLAAFGTEEQKREYLVPAIRGEKVGALASTEPSGGSDIVEATQCEAIDDGHFWIVTGEKKFITNGPVADFIVTLVRTRPQRTTNSLSLLIIPTDTPGFRVRQTLRKLGLHTSPTGWIVFDGCRVSKRLTLGRPNFGFFYLQNFLEERLITGAIGVSAGSLVLQETMGYIRQRIVYRRPLSQHQSVRHRIAELAAKLEMAKCFVYSVSEAYRDGRASLKEICMVKFTVADIVQHLVTECLQLHGGFGFLEENWLSRVYRDARLLSIGGGASEVMKDLVASCLRL